jgi:hypothetical protein
MHACAIDLRITWSFVRDLTGYTDTTDLIGGDYIVSGVRNPVSKNWGFAPHSPSNPVSSSLLPFLSLPLSSPPLPLLRGPGYRNSESFLN